MKEDPLQSAFSAIYQAESDAIFRFCCLRISDREQALDLTQETFARLWQSMRKGEEVAAPRAFLFAVAHHLIIDWYRRKKPLSLEGLLGGEDEGGYRGLAEPSDGRDPALEAEGRLLLDAIDRLGPSYRHAVYLRFVEGLPPPDIGRVLGISANAASVRVNRGLEELRRMSGYAKDRPGKGESKELS